MKLISVGLSFKTSPVELREKVSFSPKRIPDVLERIRSEFGGAGVVLLSTCNRTELYVSATPLSVTVDQVASSLMSVAGVCAQKEEWDSHVYTYTDHAAAEHLLAVASSLDSMVVGETEILGQVKQAYFAAADSLPAGTILHDLFQTAFRVAKRVHSETAIAHGRVSVSSIAVEFAAKVFEDLASKTVMIVGAGETGELTLKALSDRGVREILVFNRAVPKCQQIAAKYGGRAMSFDAIDAHLASADIVISATSAPHCIIHTAAVKAAMAQRHGQPLLMIDIAVPRDIEVLVGGIDNVYLYDIDDLQKVANENMERRQRDVGLAWGIIRKEAQALSGLTTGMSVSHLLKTLNRDVDGVIEVEMERTLAKSSLGTLPAAEQVEVAELVRRVAGKLLAGPRHRLTDASKNGRWEEYSRVAGDLFGISPDTTDTIDTDDTK